jgi:hypothetical protein
MNKRTLQAMVNELAKYVKISEDLSSLDVCLTKLTVEESLKTWMGYLEVMKKTTSDTIIGVSGA